MRQTRLQIAKPDIVSYFDSQPKRIFTRSDLDATMQQHRQFWRLAQRTTTNEFVNFLVSTSKLHIISLDFPGRGDIRYVWDQAPFLEIAVSLRPRSYISHFTAVKAHGLTDQIPKTIYINHEQPGRSDPEAKLRQAGIDAAFARPQRVSNRVATLGEYRICILSGQNTHNTGVVLEKVPDIYTGLDALVPITNLERTLIDIAVRPAYSGGVAEVLNAYRTALGRASVNRLAALLKQIDYVYPYHQAIGFYLQRAGYAASAVSLLSEFPITYDFYLTHEMRDMDYVEEWRLYVPKGLK